MTRPTGGDAGFTLIETLVALAIVGIVLSTGYGVFGAGLRAASRDEDRLLLALVAQNLLARSRFDYFPAGEALTGDIGGGLRWRIEGEPYPLPEDLLPELPASVAEADDSFGRESGDAERESGFDRRAASEAGSGGSAEETGGSTLGDPQEEERQEREPVRLRLVRVTVEKGAERYVLAGLVTEPRANRDRLP